jgi:hypothetical protein
MNYEFTCAQNLEQHLQRPDTLFLTGDLGVGPSEQLSTKPSRLYARPGGSDTREADEDVDRSGREEDVPRHDVEPADHHGRAEEEPAEGVE